MSIIVHTLGYPRTIVSKVGAFGWDPTWQSVEDIRRWATRFAKGHAENVEVYASGKMLSQLAKVRASFGLIEVRPQHPTEGEGTLFRVSELEVFVY